MSITLDLTTIISWFLTVIAFVLFLVERRKNVRLPYYMAIQGILRACAEKSKFYASYYGEIRDRQSKIPDEEITLFVQTVYSDYISLMEHIMGSLKAVEPEKDIPFDTRQFINPKQESEQ